MSTNGCPNIETNKANCTCPSLDCQRHGLCCQCIAAHTEKDSLTHCLKTRIQQSQPFRDHVTNLMNPPE